MDNLQKLKKQLLANAVEADSQVISILNYLRYSLKKALTEEDIKTEILGIIQDINDFVNAKLNPPTKTLIEEIEFRESCGSLSQYMIRRGIL